MTKALDFLKKVVEKFGGTATYKGKKYEVIDIIDKGEKGNFFILKGVKKAISAKEIERWDPI